MIMITISSPIAILDSTVVNLDPLPGSITVTFVNFGLEPAKCATDTQYSPVSSISTLVMVMLLLLLENWNSVLSNTSKEWFPAGLKLHVIFSL